MVGVALEIFGILGVATGLACAAIALIMALSRRGEPASRKEKAYRVFTVLFIVAGIAMFIAGRGMAA